MGGRRPPLQTPGLFRPSPRFPDPTLRSFLPDIAVMAPEYRSVLLLVGLAVAGQAVRTLILDPGDAPGSIVLLGGPGGDSAAALAHRDSARAAAAPLREGELIDLDRAPAAQLARLPGIGPGLARRLVEYREAHGAFGGIERLDQVPGVGPSLLDRLSGHVRFSGIPAPKVVPGPATSQIRSLNVNAVSANELAKLPGLGPGRATAIVAYRESHGPFASIEALTNVPGIGPATVAKLRHMLDIR